MANIQLNKKMYGAKSAGDIIDKSFSELLKSKEPININRLFKVYEELFYDVPKEGDKSHTTLIQRSTDYIRNYIDPKDAQIDALINRIETLEEELSTDIENEHPFFRNNSFISSNPQTGAIYVMENGRKRSIQGWELTKTIMNINGIMVNHSDAILLLQSDTIEGIPSGEPIHTEQDLNVYDYILPTTTQNFYGVRTSLDALIVSEGQLIQLRDLLDEKEAAGRITREDIISGLEGGGMESNNSGEYGR
tara:strand:+ start:60 stop:806 length:747 start_codon:yes stop_codon:yes gene_type:complete